MSVTILSVFAVVFLVVTMSQFSAAGLRRLRSRSYEHGFRRRTQIQNRRTAQIARLESEIVTPASRGAVPWRIMEVREVVRESADCKSFYLVDPHRQELPGYFPGQYLMVRPALASGKQATRCYSLSDAPRRDHYRITGQVSAALGHFDHVVIDTHQVSNTDLSVSGIRSVSCFSLFGLWVNHG